MNVPQLKLFPLHTGIWEGTYTRISPKGEIIYKHKSKLSFKLIDNRWYQTNYYQFDNGREEFHNFGIALFNEEGIMTFDNPRIYGESWESRDNIQLWWTYKDQPGSKLYEIITLIDPGHRMRVWQFSRNNAFEGLMMIEERQTDVDENVPLSHFDQPSYIKEAPGGE